MGGERTRWRCRARELIKASTFDIEHTSDSNEAASLEKGPRLPPIAPSLCSRAMSRIVLPALLRDARPLYMVGLQPALNNLVSTYNSHTGPLNTIQFDYNDVFPWIQVAVVVIAFAVGTAMFLSAFLVPDNGQKQMMDKRSRDVLQRLKGESQGRASCTRGDLRKGVRGAQRRYLSGVSCCKTIGLLSLNIQSRALL